MAHKKFFLFLRGFVVFIFCLQAMIPWNTVALADDGVVEQTPAPTEPSDPTPPEETPAETPVEVVEDTATPEPVEPSPTTDHGQEAVVEETPQPETDTPVETTTEPEPIVADLPDDVELVVLADDQTALPLGSQQAEDIIASADPWYCPGDIQWTADGTGCVKFTGSTGLDNFQLALDHAVSQMTTGTIYVEVGQTFGNISEDFSGMNSGITLTIIGGVNLSTGQVTGSSTANSISFQNLSNGGTLLLSNFIIIDNSTGNAATFTNIENLSLTNLTIQDANNGHALLINSSTGSVNLDTITIQETGAGDGLQIGSSNHIVVDHVVINEGGNGNGANFLTNSDLILRNSSVVENGAGYALAFSANTDAQVINSEFQSQSDSDAVWAISGNNSARFEGNTIRFITPVYNSALGNLNSAVIFYNTSGNIEFNRNNLIIQRPSGTQTGFTNGIYIFSPDVPSGNFSAVGNVLDGGSSGLTSNAVVIGNINNSASMLFNWNQICNWSSGYFVNTTSINVDGTHNSYCGATPTNSGASATIRGPVQYLPVATNEDEDGDGVLNVEDSCPTVINPGAAQTSDVDEDGIVDACDPQDNRDPDHDGIQNYADTCPLVANPGAGQTLDTDGDTIPDACDTTPNGDTDGDGVDNLTDTCPLVSNAGQAQTADVDEDGVADACDDQDNGDDDGDGVQNYADTCPLVANPGTGQTTDTDSDGLPDACDPTPNGDTDGDGVDNNSDTCPLVSNPGAGQTADTDGDGIPNACDDQDNGDTDGDGVQNYIDTCPKNPNPGAAQTADRDGDGIPDACDPYDNGDTDGDGVDNQTDTCPLNYNPGPGQDTDSDGDVIPDACDSTPNGDDDLDHVDDAVDNCLNNWNPLQTDSDNDGVGDACDPVPVPTDDAGAKPAGQASPSAPFVPQSDCLSASILTVKGGGELQLDQLPCGYLPAGKQVGADALPAELPDGLVFETGLRFDLSQATGDSAPLPIYTAASLSFDLPDASANWQILFWDTDLNDGAGGWVAIPAVLDKDTLTARITRTGLYILARG